jgi:uncharacterized protein (DUF488 family)
VGYGNRTLEEFFAVLRSHAITDLVDVRSVPWSGFNPEYGRDRLAGHAVDNGLAWAYMGDTLGGKGVSSMGWRFKDGLRRLAALSSTRCVAAMCCELRPEECHRVRILGAAWTALGVPVLHIDERGLAITQREAEARRNGGNATLEVGLPLMVGRR